jgi:hypothetical protein
MEARKITVVSTKTQKKSVIMSGAETLGELKKDLREAGIEYDGMTFYEGTSKTELKTDESVLPKDVPYTNRTTGETKNTNELVFMLTNTNKKIRSGAMTRAEAYSTIKAQGLQSACVSMYGKNFTQCSTNDLIVLIQKKGKKAAEPAKVVEAPKTETIAAAAPATPSAPAPVAECVDTQARAALTKLVEILEDNETINEYEAQDVLDLLGGATVAPTVSENYRPDSGSPYSDNEIDAMFRGMC